MRCYICGKKATIKDVDPFLKELPELKDDPNEPLQEEWWCDECYKERLNDI